MNLKELFGQHISELENPERIEIDWKESPFHNMAGYLVGVGSSIEERFETGKNDAVVKLDGLEHAIMIHLSRLK